MSADQAPEAWRRELLNYVRRAFARRPYEPVLMAVRAMRARQARRGAPAGLAFDAGLPGDAPAGQAALPLRRGHAPAPSHVRLATRTWPLSAGDPWTQVFEDPEDAFSAHRFSWVAPALASSGAAAPVARAMLRRWLADRGGTGDGPGWDSYSVAERISAAVYLQSAAAPGGADAGLDAAIRTHARHLHAHLEVRGANTNNHLLNDARALYLAGAWLVDAPLLARARAIFDFAVPAMYQEGFLREGSTHYHQLLHRTLTEVALLASLAGDAAFGERAAAWASESASAARFVNAGLPDMPRIGDLSPDFPPEVLAAWARWFEADVPGADCNTPPDVAARGGYLRAVASGFLLHAWVNPAGHVPAWSHAHADLGAFTLSWHGQPLLIDGGRSTYAATEIGAFGRSVRSHNAVSIDGFEPCIAHGVNGYPELLDREYGDARPVARVAGGGRAARVEIAHEGFARLGSGMRYSRSVALGPDGVTIEDRITGAGRHRVETFFHFAPECAVDPAGPGRWRVERPGAPALLFESGAGASLHRGVREPRLMGWSAREYGAAVPSPSLVCGHEGDLPTVQTYALRHA